MAILRERVSDLPVPVVRQKTTSFEAECHGGDSSGGGAGQLAEPGSIYSWLRHDANRACHCGARPLSAKPSHVQGPLRAESSHM